jgi:hypothetical protein
MNFSSKNHRRIRHIRDLSDDPHLIPYQYFQMNAEVALKLRRNCAEIVLKLFCHRVAVRSKHSLILNSIEATDVQERI